MGTSETYIESFNRLKKKTESEMTNGKKKFTSYKDELNLCGNKNLGMVFGIYIADNSERAAYRRIKNYKCFRIEKDVAEKFGIKDFQIRLCDPDQYEYSDDPEVASKEREVIETLSDTLSSIIDNWDAWERLKIAKYPPQSNKYLTIQYMKVFRKTDLSGNEDKTFEPGVKVIISRSDAYCRKFESFADDQFMLTGDMSAFLEELISREKRIRSSKFMIKSNLPSGAKSYEFTIQQIPDAKGVEITDEDLNRAGDIYTEIVNVRKGGINIEEYKKWAKMLSSYYNEIVNSVTEGSEPPKGESIVKVGEEIPDNLNPFA